jgi:hypothetical protein
MNLVMLRVVLLLVAVVVWGYGYRVDDANIRLAGIAIMVIALAMRFFGRRPPRDRDDLPGA